MPYLRSIGLWCYFGLATVVCASAAALAALVDRKGTLWWPISQLWARGILGLGIAPSQRLAGAQALAHPAARIVMANHASHLDVLFLIARIGTPLRFLTKRELFYIPLFGQAIWLVGHIPINRGNRRSAFQSLDRAANQIKAGKTLLIFPEGTRSPGGGLGDFKKGGFVLAVKSGAPIVPIGIAGTALLLPKRGFLFGRGPIVGVVGEPIDTRSYTLETKDDLMRLVRQRIDALSQEAQGLIASGG
jgi:1-acyl-sn-glycerol-3-phosphate acyltransferase